ncbi:hypothetical protein [Ferrimonas pelagia]|uniref:hypothetical protein n=1 Tax=Ferrimonas pelagia TaxID=1177826 RepID=UPI0031EFF248
MDGKKKYETYKIVTGPLNNKYIDSRNVSNLQEVKVTKVTKGFEDRLYLVNSLDNNALGSDMSWVQPKAGRGCGRGKKPSSLWRLMVPPSPTLSIPKENTLGGSSRRHPRREQP